MLLFIAYVLVVVLWWSHRKLRQEFDEAAVALGALGNRLNAMEHPYVAPVAAPAAVKTEPPPVVVEEPPAVWEETAAPPPLVVEAPEEMPEPLPMVEEEPVVTHTAPPPLPSFLRAEPAEEAVPVSQQSRNWEEAIGGNLLNKLGALVLVIGIALFLGYSFARMGPAGRAFTSLGVSVAILGGGLWLERSETYRVFSRGLIAAGWASLYFTSYAMYAVDAARVIANPFVGTVIMIAVGAAMVGHSMRYRVQSLTALAYGCVFAALALSESNTFVAVALLPLAASMLYMARRFAWNGLALFAAAATYATFLSRPDSGATLLAIQSMLLMFWLLFEAFDLLRVRSTESGDRDALLFGVNAAAGLGASAALWYRMAQGDMWQFCVAGSLLYLVSAWVRFPQGANSMWEFAMTISVALAGLGIFSGVERLWASLAYIALAEAVFFLSLRVQHVLLRVLAMLAFGVAVLEIGARAAAEPGSSVIGGVSIDNWAPAVAVLAAVFYLNRVLAPASRYFGYLASACVALILAMEPPVGLAGASVLVFGMGLFEFGVRRGLVDFRMQGCGLTALGAFGTALAYFDASANAAVTVGVAVLLLAQAIRATRWLDGLAENERLWVRLGASYLTALTTIPAVCLAVPEPYWGAALLGVSLLLHELAFRNLPGEMLWPASFVHAMASRFVLEHLGEIEKSPETAVWVSFGAAAIATYWLAVRLLRERSEMRWLQRIVYPWVGGGFAIVTLWMVLPDVWVPAGLGVLAFGAMEAGLRLGTRNLIWHGRAMSLLAAGSAQVMDRRDVALSVNVGSQAVLQWWMWRRLLEQPIARVHGWIAVAGLAILMPAVAGDHAVIGWSVLGAALAVAANRLKIVDLRWQSAVIAVPATLAALQDGPFAYALHLWCVMAWFLLAVVLEPRVERSVPRIVYSAAAAILGATAIFHSVDGTMLTLGWALEGIGLLAFGFPARERTLRLAGLALLLGCIGKVFVYDLRNLETMYRILSFVGLGATLIFVSFIYTRFKDQLRRYL